MSGNLLERLEQLTCEDASALHRLIVSLNPSGNTLRGILQLVDEICARDQITLAQVLGRKELCAVAQDEQLSRKEKQKKTRQLLAGIRYPEIERIRRVLAEAQRKLVEETGLNIKMPEELEGDVVSVTVTARSAAEFCEAAKRLEQLAAHPAAAQIFSVLRGEE